MELVEGRTLRELLVSGPLPLRKTLGIAAQVAGGLSRAHEAGIVHRDLKPENLMVSKDELVSTRRAILRGAAAAFLSSSLFGGKARPGGGAAPDRTPNFFMSSSPFSLSSLSVTSQQAEATWFVLRTAPGCKQGLTPAPTSLSTPSPRRCLLKKSLRPGSLCGTRPGDHPARGVRRLSAPAARGDTALPSSREPLRAGEGSVGGSIRGSLRLLARDGGRGGGSVSGLRDLRERVRAAPLRRLSTRCPGGVLV